MKQTANILLVFCYLLALGCSERITADQASKHIGDKITVCGLVAQATTVQYARGIPTFINLDKKYPDQPFTIVIWGKDLGKFSNLLRKLKKSGQICVTGTITEYRGKPQIVADNPNQIEIP